MDILPHLTPALMALFRISGIFIYAPVLGSSIIPLQIKALFALALTAASYGVVYPILLESGQLPLEFSFWALAPVMASELLIGVMIGFLAGLPLVACQLGGQTIGQQLGVGLARAFNPAFDDEAEVIGQMLFYMAMATFLLAGGVEILLRFTLDTFEHVPVGAFILSTDLIAVCLGALTSAFELAIRIAAPVLALIFLQTFALGFISRTAPAFNIMSLGFPMRVVVGLIMLIATIYAIDEIIADEMFDVLEAIEELVAKGFNL